MQQKEDVIVNIQYRTETSLQPTLLIQESIQIVTVNIFQASSMHVNVQRILLFSSASAFYIQKTVTVLNKYLSIVNGI